MMINLFEDWEESQLLKSNLMNDSAMQMRVFQFIYQFIKDNLIN